MIVIKRGKDRFEIKDINLNDLTKIKIALMGKLEESKGYLKEANKPDAIKYHEEYKASLESMINALNDL